MSNTSAKSQVEVDQRGAARDRELGLRLAVDDLDVEAGLGAHALQEFGAVVGKPAGLGGDQAGAGDAVPLDLGRADLQRLDGALDGRLRQPAAGRHALAEADDARERVDHLEAAPRRAGHQQAAIVGAEIERGVGGPRRLAHGRRRERRIDRGDGFSGQRPAGRRSRARVGRIPRLAFPTLPVRGAQLGRALLVFPALHLRLPRPISAVPSSVVLFELEGTLAGRGPG